MSKAKQYECTAKPSYSAIDNLFTSVLWRRLYHNMRFPENFTEEMKEKYFREIVDQTLSDTPPEKT
jgi:hypothetical protein